MPWLKQHSPRIDWGQGKITFESERCTTWCLKESPTVYAIPEDEAREGNLKVEFGVAQSQKDQQVKVQKLDPQAKIPSRESAHAAGHDLYANKSKTIPAPGPRPRSCPNPNINHTTKRNLWHDSAKKRYGS